MYEDRTHTSRVTTYRADHYTNNTVEPSQRIELCLSLYKRLVAPCAKAGFGSWIRTTLGSFKGFRPTARRTRSGTRYRNRTRVTYLEGRCHAIRPISLAERERIELPGLLHPTVFKTATHANVRRSVVLSLRSRTAPERHRPVLPLH